MKTTSARERLAWFHERIIGGSFPNASSLSERFGISLRQADRDVAAMREKYGAPLEYDAMRRGYKYTEDFKFTDMVRSDDSENTVTAIACTESADNDAVQLTIPYRAEIEIFDRLTRLELGKIIIGRGKGKNRYLCEFRNPDFFIGMLLSTGKSIKIVSPEWLRERLVESCERLLAENK